MPSGSKKRKAAKKKKGNESSTNPSSNDPQGNDELTSQDDKGSDCGEGVSSTHHDHDDDHHHHHPFNEGNEELEEGKPTSSADAKSIKEVTVDKEIDEAVGGRTEDGGVVIERELKSEENCESNDVNVVDIKPAKQSEIENGKFGSCSNVEVVNEKNLKDEAYNTVKETVAYDELVKSIDSSHAKMTHITEDEPVEENGNSVESVNWPASRLGGTEFSLKKNGDKANVLSDENGRTSSLEEPKPNEFDNNVLPHVSRSPLPESINGTEHIKDSDTPESSENQPLVESDPRMAQKTSWLSCCGLFEVLSGSNR